MEQFAFGVLVDHVATALARDCNPSFSSTEQISRAVRRGSLDIRNPKIQVPTANLGHPVKREEKFLSAQADAFAGANAEEKIGLLRSK
jgi:hypothetical protein